MVYANSDFKISVTLGKSASATCAMLSAAYGTEAVKKSRVAYMVQTVFRERGRH